MFSEMVADLGQGRLPEKIALRQRFDMAMIKKMGVVLLPPAFWTEDPKINPRVEHLFWASLLLLDRERMDLALAVLATEQAEHVRSMALPQELPGQARDLVRRLLEQIGDERLRESLRRELQQAVPEWLEEAAALGRSERVGHGY